MSVYLGGTGCVQSKAALPSRFAGELRRADAFVRLAVGAAHTALDKALPRSLRSGRCGLVLGTAFGPMQSNFDFVDQVLYEEQGSPTLFSHSVFNTAAGFLSRIFGFSGGALTLTDFAFPFFQALQQGWMMIDSGWLEACLVLQVETYSALLADAQLRLGFPGAERWPSGAAAWFLTGDRCRHEKELVSIEVMTRSVDGWYHLATEERIFWESGCFVSRSPLGSAMMGTRLISGAQAAAPCLTITGACGSVEISCRNNGFAPQRAQ